MRTLWILAAAAALLAAPAAQAATSDSVRLTGSIDQSADSLAGLVFIGDGSDSLLRFQVRGNESYALSWERARASVQSPLLCDVADMCDDYGQTSPLDSTPERHPEGGTWSDLQLRLIDVDLAPQVHVIPLAGASIQATSGGIDLDAVSSPCLMTEGIVTQSEASCTGYQEDEPQFSWVPLGDRVQRADARGALTVLVDGDIAIELSGVVVETGDGTRIDTTTPSSSGAGVSERRFARVIVHDALLQIQIDSPELVHWATGEAESMVVGSAVIDAPDGELGVESLTLPAGERLVEGSFLLATDADDDGLSIVGERRAPDGSPLATSTAGDTMGGWWLAIAIAIIPAIAVSIMIRRRAAALSMSRVEDALQQGQYGRAAKLSERIIRFQPYQESAHLSRAIALTKAGRPDEAVAGLDDYMARADPQDGTLHYVKGTALRQLGRLEEARVALEEAVQRTPALAAEVGPPFAPDEGRAYT